MCRSWFQAGRHGHHSYSSILAHSPCLLCCVRGWGLLLWIHMYIIRIYWKYWLLWHYLGEKVTQLQVLVLCLCIRKSSFCISHTMTCKQYCVMLVSLQNQYVLVKILFSNSRLEGWRLKDIFCTGFNQHPAHSCDRTQKKLIVVHRTLRYFLLTF